MRLQDFIIEEQELIESVESQRELEKARTVIANQLGSMTKTRDKEKISDDVKYFFTNHSQYHPGTKCVLFDLHTEDLDFPPDEYPLTHKFLTQPGIIVAVAVLHPMEDPSYGEWGLRTQDQTSLKMLSTRQEALAFGKLYLNLSLSADKDIISGLVLQRQSGWDDLQESITEGKFSTTLLHELQHAFDNYRSGEGVSRDNKKTPKTGWIDKNYYKDNVSYDEDVQFSHEINARYAQAINSIKKRLGAEHGQKEENEGISFNLILRMFKKEIQGWEQMSPQIQKRLISRLGQEYTKGNFAKMGKVSLPLTQIKKRIESINGVAPRSVSFDTDGLFARFMLKINSVKFTSEQNNTIYSFIKTLSDISDQYNITMVLPKALVAKFDDIELYQIMKKFGGWKTRNYNKSQYVHHSVTKHY